MVNYQRTVMEAWQKMLEKEGGGGERGLFCCGLASYSVLKPLLVPTPPYMFILSHTLSKALFLGYMKGLQGLKCKPDHTHR